jgi:hypothetical protein
MRILPGTLQTIAHEAVSSRMLVNIGVSKPDFIPTIMRLFSEEGPLVSILDIKNLKTKGLNFSTNNENYRTVGSNHIQFRYEHSDWRKFRWVPGPRGNAFECPAYPTEPGRNQSIIYAWSDMNWAGFQEVIELADNRTQVYSLVDPVEDDNNTFRYKLKIVTDDNDDFVDPMLLAEGMEAAATMNLHEQDFSERATQKYINGVFGDSFLSLQRFMYSWSGTAKAMDNGKVTGKFVEHTDNKGRKQNLFLTEAHERMMRMAAEYLNYQIIWGKSTVSVDTKRVILKNEKGREVMSGNGIMNANDGSIDFPMQNGWTKKYIEYLLSEMDGYIRPGEDGEREVVFLAAPKSYLSFQSCMNEMGVTMNSNIEGSGSNKGINDTYAYYELGGLKIIPKRYAALATNRRPGIDLQDGSRSNDWDCIAVPIGRTEMGERGIELVQLRPMAEGTVAGIDEGGNIATSVDGSSKHILFQNGVISRIQPFRIYRPFYARPLPTIQRGN